MSKAAVQVNGVKEVQDAIAVFGRTVSLKVSKAIQASALEAVVDVRNAIQGPPKTGRKYPRGEKTHQASAAGEAPATDTGALVSSLYFTKVNDFTAAIGSRLAYAFFLEFGTLRPAPSPDFIGPRLAFTKPRPSWVPAAERAIPRLEKRLKRIVAEAKARAEKKAK
jgi:phage gpG-like protein